jgi:DNA-binding NarL/FixJ family response regulator
VSPTRGRRRLSVVIGSDSPVILAGLAAAMRHEGLTVVGAVSRFDRLAERLLAGEHVDGLILATANADVDELLPILDDRPDRMAAVVLLGDVSTRVHADPIRTRGAVCLSFAANPNEIAAGLGRSRALTDGVTTVRETIVRGVGGYLSPRETQTLDRAARGETNDEIATALGVGSETIKTHLRHAFRKLGVRNRTEAVAAYLEAGAA